MNRKRGAMLLAGLCLIVFAAAGETVWAARRTVTLKVPAADSAGLATKVRVLLKGIEGVVKVTTDHNEKVAEVTFDDEKTDVEAFLTKLKDADLPAKEEAE